MDSPLQYAPSTLLPRLDPGRERQPASFHPVKDKVVIEERAGDVVPRQQPLLHRLQPPRDAEVELGAAHRRHLARGQQLAVDGGVPVRVDGDAVHLQRISTWKNDQVQPGKTSITPPRVRTRLVPTRGQVEVGVVRQVDGSRQGGRGLERDLDAAIESPERVCDAGHQVPRIPLVSVRREVTVWKMMETEGNK